MVVEYYHKCVYVVTEWKVKKKKKMILRIFISDLGKTPCFALE